MSSDLIVAHRLIALTFGLRRNLRCWEVIAWFQHGHSPKYIILWIGLTWLPLILGAWCTTVGIIYARPDALSFVSPQPGKPSSWALRLGITPTVVNVCVFTIPVVQTVSVVIPAVLAQRQFSMAFEHYRRWSAALPSGATLSRELLLDAQQIWFKVLDAAYYLSICMAVWEAWVCGLFICYCLAGGSLIAMLRDQLETLKSFKQNRSFSESFAVQKKSNPLPVRRASEVYAAPAMVPQAVAVGGDLEKQMFGTSDTGMLSVQAPPRSLSITSNTSDSATLVSGDTGFKRSPSFTAQNCKPAPGSRRGTSETNAAETAAQTASMYFTRDELENEDEPAQSFFPAVRPSAFERPTQAQTAAGKQNSHKRYLEKFYLNFVVQFAGLMMCILFFAVFCGKLITTWYSAWEANEFAMALQTALLVVAWVTVVLASVIIFAILSRTYEPVLSNFGAVTTSRSSGSRRASLVRANNAGSGGARKPGRRLSEAKSWALSTLSQLSSGEDRRSQDIGLDRVRHGRGNSRGGSFSGPGRSSLHGYSELDGEHVSPYVEQDPPSPKSQPLTLRKPTSSSTPDLQAAKPSARQPHEPRRQRSFRSASSSSKSNKASGVMVEQTVSTIVEDPAVEDYYRIERPSRAARTSPSKSDLSEQEIYTPHTLDGDLSTPGRFNSHWADSPATPATIWTPSTPSSTRPLMGADGKSPQLPDTVDAEGQEWVLHRSPSDAAPRPPRARRPTAGDDSVGLGIAMATTPWTAPSVWDSGEPDAALVQEDAEMRLRMASRPATGSSAKRS